MPVDHLGQDNLEQNNLEQKKDNLEQKQENQEILEKQGTLQEENKEEIKPSKFAQLMNNTKEMFKKTADYILGLTKTSGNYLKNRFKTKAKNDGNNFEFENNQPGFAKKAVRYVMNATKKGVSKTAKLVKAFFANRHVRIALASMIVTAAVVPFLGAIAGFTAAVGRSAIVAAASFIARVPSVMSALGEFFAKNIAARSVAVFAGVFTTIELADKMKVKEKVVKAFTFKKSSCCGDKHITKVAENNQEFENEIDMDENKRKVTPRL